ncbi:hypothetical protein NV379_02495 [Paenibacillus sp. N1-5-1-14]|uniref:hypothetical protein n=1 Tax=Paenibacillus radicibacter TaxID=2972488 RepID=UPI00215995DC|nr:hypothetical protein [Paenibacillus radicibacter]MCR8641516.1 hypothetical protein [Paenibacillus radicibacter]
MKLVKKIQTVVDNNCISAIRSELDELPGETELLPALFEGNLDSFLKYLNEKDEIALEYRHDYQTEVTYSLGKDEDTVYLKDVTFRFTNEENEDKDGTIMKDEIILRIFEDIENESVVRKFNIEIEFYNTNTSKAHSILSAIKINSFADRNTNIIYDDFSTEPLFEYEMALYYKLRHRRMSQWNCIRYEDYTGAGLKAVVEEVPKLDLTVPGEYFTSTTTFSGTVLDYIAVLLEDPDFRYRSRLQVESHMINAAAQLLKDRDMLDEIKLEPFTGFEHAKEVIVVPKDGSTASTIVFLRE